VRAIWRTRWASSVLVALLCLCVGAPVRASAQPAQPAGSTKPLTVPTGPLPEPETAAQLPTAERVLAAAEALRERGYEELPILAWALLETARAEGRADLVERAVDLAPSSPGVRFEAARISGNLGELLHALAALGTSLPGALFALAFAGVVLGGGVLAIALGVSLVAALRGLGLHGHAFGHKLAAKDPPSWPGVLLILAGLAALPLFGVGPIALAGLFGAAGALRLPKGETFLVALALCSAGFALGPGLDRMAPALAAVGREPALLAAWRIDRGQALPGDLERVQSASQRAPDDGVFKLALATMSLRSGDLALAEQALGTPGDAASPTLEAAALNLRGILRLAQGDLGQAIPAFERARAAQESAPVDFNLSQAYGRALRLTDQQPAFEAARKLDGELVSKYMANEDANVHRYLIESSLPLELYALRALAPSEDSRALAAELRERLLGTLQRDRLWMLLPAAGLFALLFRRSTVGRCSRCDQPICYRCSRQAMSGGTCMRCVRLFIKRERTDPRLRKLELDRDRQRQRRAIVGQAFGALVAPGCVDLADGRSARGLALLFATGAGFAALNAPGGLPVPWDLGTLGYALPVVTALCLLAPTLALGAVQFVKKLGQLRRRE